MGANNAFLLAVVLAGTICLSANLADADLWGHVRYGQDVLRDRALSPTATYTYSAPGHPWYNHENVAEIASAAAVNLAGNLGLLSLALFIRLSIVVLLVAAARRQQVSPFTLCVVVLLACLNLSASTSLRPQLFSYLFFALEIALLERLTSRTAGQLVRSPTGWGLVLLMIVWTNTHGGFLAGLAVAGFYLTCQALEALRKEGRTAWPFTASKSIPSMPSFPPHPPNPPLPQGERGEPESLVEATPVVAPLSPPLPSWERGPGGEGVEPRREGVFSSQALCLHHALLVLALCLATLVNPYGYHYHVWLYHDLTIPRPEITEWAPLSYQHSNFIPFVLLATLAAIAVLTHWRNIPWPRIATLVVVLWQTIAHHRHLPFFAILVAMWLPGAIEAVRRRWLAGGAQAEREFTLPVTLSWLAVAVLAGYLGWRNRDIFVDKAEYPVAAFGYMADHELQGKLVVFFNWAQYALAAFSPPTTVQYDGRCRTCYPQRQADLHFDLFHGDVPGLRQRDGASGPIDPNRVLDEGQPDLVLFPRTLPVAVATLESRTDWVLLYQDGLAHLWGRKSRYDDPRSGSYIPPEQRRIGDEPQQGLVPWPAFPR